jgi:hypothetical protein
MLILPAYCKIPTSTLFKHGQRQKRKSEFGIFINPFLKDNPYRDGACTIEKHAILYLTVSAALGIVVLMQLLLQESH